MSSAAMLRVLLACAALALAAAPRAQEATERFIPIGQSPGLSGLHTYIGALAAYDADRQVLQVDGPEGASEVRITAQTRIWLDRSKLGKTNLVGTPGDLVPGRRIEIYVASADQTAADWIKIEVSE